ncbi:hypothetical protein ZHAS_00016654 [Anopheles sinensis]|uniref:Uncharacterized protein n=1 Tax=Anopheles sinensis TaxID=74873 RepID=A0A084WEL5_ANOSI|nr:hypothetical protein ZHAS_00016654 [Anopheles sinensis]
MASRKISTVSDSVTIVGGGGIVGINHRYRAEGGICSNEPNQNNNYHRRQEPHFPQIKIVIDEPELNDPEAPALGAMALQPLRRQATVHRGSKPSTGMGKKSPNASSFLTIFDSTGGQAGARRRTNGGKVASYDEHYYSPVEGLHLYRGDYVDDDEEDYGIDTDGYRQTRLHRGRGTRDHQDEEEDDEEEHDNDDDGEEHEDVDDEEDDEENGGDYP